MLSANLVALRQKLEVELGQKHLFPADATDEQVLPLLSQLAQFDSTYPGGINAYVQRSRRLLQASSEGRASLGGAKLRVPDRVFTAPEPFSAAWGELEDEGLALLRKTAFVLVAGGLGERLGFSDIKLSLPVETATRRTYLQFYFDWIRVTAGPGSTVIIMTSDDTDARTRALLDGQSSFGLSNVVVLKQEMVPCLADNTASLVSRRDAAAAGGALHLLSKPHGHGDVHQLIHASGLAERLQRDGLEFIAFMQDTNAAATITLPVSLAISKRNALSMNFTCVPRLPGEAVGSLCHVEFPASEDGLTTPPPRVCNIEYNVLGPLLEATTGRGDVPAEGEGQRFSAFPGSINTLLLALPAYADAMRQCQGLVPEFVNPKYADKTRTTFKSPTRLETLMQDVALMLDPAGVGGTVFNRDLYSPVKNSLDDAVAKVAAGLDGHTACTGEAAVLAHMRWRLRALVPSILSTRTDLRSDVPDVSVRGTMRIQLFPIVVYDASFAASQSQLAARFGDGATLDIVQPNRCALIIDGDGEVLIKGLKLDGALHITAAPGVRVAIDGLDVSNAGWSVVPLESHGALSDDEREALTEVDRIRGYVLRKNATQRIVISEPGQYIVGRDGNVVLLSATTTATSSSL